MPLKAPNLDDRSYADLKKEALLRIPRYTPEWTDFNESDPGIALVELFAWMGDILLHRLNQVPDRNYIKFLKLLNLELRPPESAKALLTFTIDPKAQVLPLPPRSRFAAKSLLDGSLAVFETDQGLDLVSLELGYLQSYASAFLDITQNNQVLGSPFYPFGWKPQVGCALYLGFTPIKALNPGQRLFPQQLRLQIYLPQRDQAAQPVSCIENLHPPGPPVELVWEYRHPNDPERWRKLNTYKDETAGFTREGSVSLEGPAGVAPGIEGKVTDGACYWLRCRIVAGSYSAGAVPKLDMIRINTVCATNLTTVRDEVVGLGEGHPDENYELARKPVMKDTLILCVQPPGAVEDENPWIRVEDFLSSTRDDPHYVLDSAEGMIRFGDGKRGRIPPPGAEIIAKEYRYGGGEIGNVPAGSISIMLSSPTGVRGVANLRPSVGGRDEQALEDLKEQAPKMIKHRNRAVTHEDFEVLACQAGGVARAVALAQVHPNYPDVDVPGAVTVVIVPDIKPVPAYPSEDLLRHVCTYLDRFRLLTTEVYLKAPEYLPVSVEARIAAQPYAAFDAVSIQVAEAIDNYLDPLTWDFGKDLHPSCLYDVILDVEGVSSIQFLDVYVHDKLHAKQHEPIKLPRDGLVFGRDHKIKVVPEVDY